MLWWAVVGCLEPDASDLCPADCATKIVDVIPPDGATDVDPTVVVEARATPDDAALAIEVIGPNGERIGGAQGNGTVTVDPGFLDDGAEYVVVVTYGCGPSDGQGVAVCGEERSTFRTGARPTSTEAEPPSAVDVLVVVDDSHSMGEEQGALSAAIPVLIGGLSQFDPRYAVTTTTLVTGLVGDPPVWDGTGIADRVNVGVGGDDVEQGLASMVAVAGLDAGWRDHARFIAIVLTDEEDCSNDLDLTEPERCYTEPESLTPVAEIVDALRTVRPDAQIHGITALGGCDDAYPSARISEAATLTGGLVVDICAASLDDGLRAIAEQSVAAR
ncbi:MAG: hypothetical protein ABMB14_27410 [Myxococcota bacterium]